MLCKHYTYFLFFFFFNDTATTEIYTLSLHDALPISNPASSTSRCNHPCDATALLRDVCSGILPRSEEHTSELQSQSNLVCRLLLEKKKKKTDEHNLSNDKPRDVLTILRHDDLHMHIR